MLKKQLMIFALVLSVFSVYAQSARRTIEVTKPRMHGDDVKAVQTKLVELGFTEVGEIDGYYGPKSEAAVKELKGLIGVSVDGLIDGFVYDFLEAKNADVIFDAIKVYNKNKNERNRIFEEEFGSAPSAFSPTLSFYKTAERTAYCLYEESYDFYYLAKKIFKVSNSVYLLQSQKVPHTMLTVKVLIHGMKTPMSLKLPTCHIL